MAMCLENLTLFRDVLAGVNCRDENFRSKVGVGLLLGRSGLPRPHDLAQ